MTAGTPVSFNILKGESLMSPSTRTLVRMGHLTA